MRKPDAVLQNPYSRLPQDCTRGGDQALGPLHRRHLVPEGLHGPLLDEAIAQ